jgi:hypothetical protein
LPAPRSPPAALLLLLRKQLMMPFPPSGSPRRAEHRRDLVVVQASPERCRSSPPACLAGKLTSNLTLAVELPLLLNLVCPI